MDNTSGIVPVMGVGGNDCFGGNTFMYLFGLLILLGMFNGGFGGFGNNSFANAIGYENLATSNELQRGFDNQNLQAQTRDILSAVTSGTAQTISASTANATNAINAIKDGNASIIREFGNVETALTALSGKQQECCCNTLRAIDETKYSDALNTASINAGIAQNRYDAALNTASVNATTTAQTQKILDAIAQNKIDSLQSQVNYLQLKEATANVLRYPNQWTFNGGYFPPMMPVPMGCPCQCQNV